MKSKKEKNKKQVKKDKNFYLKEMIKKNYKKRFMF